MVNNFICDRAEGRSSCEAVT